jgi:hypothetical protein
MSSYSKWDREGYRRRVGEEEAARRRRSIMAEQWGYQLAEERKRLGFTQAGLAYVPKSAFRSSRVRQGGRGASWRRGVPATGVLLPVARSRRDDQGHHIVAAITSRGSPIAIAKPAITSALMASPAGVPSGRS